MLALVSIAKMADADILIPAESHSGSLKVNATKLFKESMSKVDEGLDALRPFAEESAAALQGCDGDGGFGHKAVLDGYVRMQEVRAKLAAEQAKLLVEMQKDLNKCAIEKQRIATGGKSLNLRDIPADLLREALNG
jgi:hypothetical protein